MTSQAVILVTGRDRPLPWGYTLSDAQPARFRWLFPRRNGGTFVANGLSANRKLSCRPGIP